MKRILALLGAIALVAAMVNPTFARPYYPPPWYLSYHSVGGALGPPDCMNEDDWDEAYWSGYGVGPLSWSPQRLCDPVIDYYHDLYWSGGNVDMSLWAQFIADNPDPVDITIISPSGIRFGAILTSVEALTGKQHGLFKVYYRACVVHDWEHDYVGYNGAQESGVWTFQVIGGPWVDANYYPRAVVVDPTTDCPNPAYSGPVYA